tara:strand:+ start:234 stop:680 length:447 start_codon:yes stop_codon:yes gene_type:complete
MKRLLFFPFIFLFASCGSGPISETLENLPDRWVESIDIPNGSRQTYLPKKQDLLITSAYATWAPKENFKTISIGDLIIGTNGKGKERSLLVGAIKCSFHNRDSFYGGEQLLFKGRWSCLAAKNKQEVDGFYKSDRLYDVFTTSPIDLD